MGRKILAKAALSLFLASVFAVFIFLLKEYTTKENRYPKLNTDFSEKQVHESVRTTDISYELYKPVNYNKNKSYPLFVCLSPSGNGSLFYENVYPAAAKYGWIMACSNDFKNNVPIDIFLPKINKIIYDVKSKYNIKVVYAGGFSGGGMASYVISYFNPSIKGLIVNSGAMHPNLYNRDRLKKIGAKKVALMCGKYDTVVSCEYMKNDEKFLASAGIDVMLMEFEGGHNIAPSKLYERAIEWLSKE